MTDQNQNITPPTQGPTGWTSEAMQARIRRRYRTEKIFKLMGLGGLLTALATLCILLVTIFYTGTSGFQETRIKLDISLSENAFAGVAALDKAEREEALRKVNYSTLIRNSLLKTFPDVKKRREVFALMKLVSNGARDEIRQKIIADPSLIGKTISLDLLASSVVDIFFKGQISRDIPQSNRKISDQQIAWLDHLSADGRIIRQFNRSFFTSGDSREPEMAGILGAAMGSFLTLLVTLLIAFPIGVSSAIYLEEFAPKNRWTDLIEININNLAAVPSIIFGLLGLAIFLNVFNMPRSAPLVGGLTLALMTLPTIIIASRAAIRAVPPSIRQAAIGLGASPIQTVFHHVLPLSMPGILTGTIIGMAQALGETAPLLMIGMVAFIVDLPHGVMDAATALPVQIFLWADSPERGFMEKTSAAIIVLIVFLIMMNGLAIWLRQKFEKNW